MAGPEVAEAWSVFPRVGASLSTKNARDCSESSILTKQLLVATMRVALLENQVEKTRTRM
jgi:hypothetical protein